MTVKLQPVIMATIIICIPLPLSKRQQFQMCISFNFRSFS